jgi:predicted nucleic acid-binding protein
VAEHLQAEFWTADKNLVDAAQKASAGWAKLAGGN